MPEPVAVVVAQCRKLAARKTSGCGSPGPAGNGSHVETARQAIERIDAQFPWLKGCELRATGRPA